MEKLGKEELKALHNKIRLITSIGFDLNLLAIDLPIEVTVKPNKKNFSKEWLEANGFEHLLES